MTSFWNKSVKTIEKSTSNKQHKHKYQKVPPAMNNNHGNDNINHQQHHDQFYPNKKNIINDNNHNNNSNNDIDTDSELDDDDFPSAEQKSFLNSTTKKSKSITRHPWADKQLSWFNHFSIGAYWFGWAFLWMPLLIIVVPHQVEKIVHGEAAGKSMGAVMLIGSIGSLLCSPVFGHLSDCSLNATGRRKPFLMVGICVTTVGLLIMSVSPPYVMYCIGFFISSCGNFITLAPYSALVPDVVPFDQRGICSGWLGACSMFGYLLGGAMSYHLEKLGFFLAFLFLAMVHAFFGWITIRFVPEVGIQSCTMYNNIEIDDEITLDETHNIDVDDRDPQFKNRSKHHKVSFFESFPFCNSDFNWLFISRFFIQMGIIIVQENLQFYLRDTKGNDYTILGVLLAADEVQACAVLFAPLLFGALISSIVAGVVSDMYGGERKFLVYFSGITMSFCCVLFGLNRWFIFDVIIALFFGFGFGVFSAIDWAMATDVLPNPHSYGRDMGMWNLAFTLPQIIGAPIVGNLLDLFREWKWINLGWFAIFIFSASNFAIGTLLVRKIAHVK